MIEALGRAILEALASGCVTILPRHFEATFGNGAVYCALDEVQDVVRNDYGDKSFSFARADVPRTSSGTLQPRVLLRPDVKAYPRGGPVLGDRYAAVTTTSGQVSRMIRWTETRPSGDAMPEIDNPRLRSCFLGSVTEPNIRKGRKMAVMNRIRPIAGGLRGRTGPADGHRRLGTACPSPTTEPVDAPPERQMKNLARELMQPNVAPGVARD